MARQECSDVCHGDCTVPQHSLSPALQEVAHRIFGCPPMINSIRAHHEHYSNPRYLSCLAMSELHGDIGRCHPYKDQFGRGVLQTVPAKLLDPEQFVPPLTSDSIPLRCKDKREILDSQMGTWDVHPPPSSMLKHYNSHGVLRGSPSQEHSPDSIAKQRILRCVLEIFHARCFKIIVTGNAIQILKEDRNGIDDYYLQIRVTADRLTIEGSPPLTSVRKAIIERLQDAHAKHRRTAQGHQTV